MNERLDAGDLSRAEAMSLLAWWLEAGVDTAVQEQPRDWQARSNTPAPSPRDKERGAAPEAPAASADARTEPQGLAPAAAGFRQERPTSLDAFHAWLAESSDLPLFRGGAARALPHGPAQAEIMLLTGIPAPEDTAEGKPMGGAAWILAERMLRAVGVAPDHAYVAALTCFSGTGTRFSAADSEACRDNMLAQIALAAPKRLLLLGDQPAKLLLRQPMASARGKLHRLAGIPAAVTFPPRHLLQNNAHKGLAWADLLLIMGD